MKKLFLTWEGNIGQLCLHYIVFIVIKMENKNIIAS